MDLLYREFLLVTLTTQTAQNYKSMKFGIDTSVLFFVLLHTIGISDIVVANAAVFFLWPTNIKRVLHVEPGVDE